ncbi:MAG: hypothetical protein AAB554_00445 [Patescibacteria group bacterium]
MGTSGLSARLTSLVFGVGVFVLLLIPRSAEAAVHNVSGWAWSGSLGWISMDCNNPGTGCVGAGGDYGLDFDDDNNLSGWAWSTTAGWICFGATCDGAAGAPPGGTPSSPVSAADHYCPGFVPCAYYDTTDQEIHGWAYVISMTDGANYRGWISLNCTDVGTNTASPHSCPSSDYAVEYDEDATQPAGEFNGYAWNGNGDASGSGWIKFGCGTPFSSCAAPGAWGARSTFVDTGWTDDIDPIEGVYSPAPSTSALTDIPVVFNGFSAPAGAIIRCVFQMSNGTHRELLHTVTTRQALVPTYSISYAMTGGDAVVDGSGNPVLWSFSSQLPDPPFGCEIQATPPEVKAVSRNVAVHPSTWTFAGAAGANSVDSVRAKYCLDGNADTDPSRAYFENTDPDANVAQCDTEGDLAFTLLRARGIPVEIRCYDGVDDDANLQRDCAGGTPATVPDRNCRGITYLCITHPPASSPQPPRP